MEQQEPDRKAVLVPVFGMGRALYPHWNWMFVEVPVKEPEFDRNKSAR